jgi:hypothetical protein
MRTGPNDTPGLGSTGRPYTWASDVSEMMSPRASFKCPTATDAEVTWIEGRERSIPLTYGMYAPYGGYLRNIVPNPDQTVLIAETTNFGALQTYDPVPFKTLEGDVVPFDGFVIGWDHSNREPSEHSKMVTRLAFPNTKDGAFTKDGPARHDGGIHALSASGAMLPLLKPSSARIAIRKGLPGGLWEAPPFSAGQR